MDSKFHITLLNPPHPGRKARLILYLPQVRKKSSLGILNSYDIFYDILIAVAKQFGFDYSEDKAKALAGEIKKIVDDKSKYTDWAKRDDIKAELKMDLILILAEYGYPPVTNDEVFKEIFEPAENFKRHNA